MRYVIALGITALLVHAGAAQTSPIAEFARFTVPAGQLPAGCALIPSTQKDSPATSSSWPADAPNPWLPTDARGKLYVHYVLGLASAVPDGPPMTPAAARRFESAMAGHIQDAYAAAYGSAEEPIVRVAAIRYDKPMTSRARVRAYRVSQLFESGAAVALVESTTAGVCYDAVRAHVAAVFAKQ